MFRPWTLLCCLDVLVTFVPCLKRCFHSVTGAAGGARDAYFDKVNIGTTILIHSPVPF